MGRVKRWLRFLTLKVLQTFSIDLIVENKELQDTVFNLKKENAELKKQISSQKPNHIPEKQLPPNFIRKHNNLLIAPNGTMYCWNCYNKQNGGEYRVVSGDEYSVICHVCNIRTELKKFIPPPQPEYDPFKNSDF